MGTPPPRISIGLPVFNGEKYLELAIQSLLVQDFEDFELIISDNASTDLTGEICKEFAARDRRIKYSRLAANCGAIPNYQRVFHSATAPYFKWATHDDLHLQGNLSRCFEALDHSPESVLMVYPKSHVIDASGQITGTASECIASENPSPHVRAARVLNNVNLSCGLFGLFRTAALKKTRLLDTFIGSDYVLLAEVAMLGFIVELPETLFQKRVHPEVSHVAQKDPNQWLAWLNQSHKKRLFRLPPRIRIGLECVRSARRLPLSLKQRVLCQTVPPSVWYLRHARRIGGIYKARFKRMLGVSPKLPALEAQKAAAKNQAGCS